MEIKREDISRPISKKETEAFLKKYPQLKKWLRIKAKGTQNNYVKALMRYLRILEKNDIASTPQDLYELAKENGEFSNYHVEILEEFQLSCEDILPEDSRSPIASITVAIMSFYSFKGKNYQFPKGRGEYKATLKKRRRYPKLDEVIPYMDTIPHLRNKMIVAVETSAPIRLESWLYLKWSHFKEVLEGVEIPLLHLTPQEMKGKGKGRYKGIHGRYSFLTPFGKSYVLRWKKEYERITRIKIDPNDKESLDQPFLVAISGETKGKPLTYSSLNQIFDRAKTEQYPFTLHNWRTTVKEALKDAGIDAESRSLMIGHKIKGVEEFYVDVTKLRARFKKAIKFLDPTFKIDTRAKRFVDIMKKKGRDITTEEASEILDKVLMELVAR